MKEQRQYLPIFAVRQEVSQLACTVCWVRVVCFRPQRTIVTEDVLCTSYSCWTVWGGVGVDTDGLSLLLCDNAVVASDS